MEHPLASTSTAIHLATDRLHELERGSEDGEPIEIEFFSAEHLSVLTRWEKDLRTDRIYPTESHANHMLNCGGLLLRRPPARGDLIEGYWRQEMIPSGPDSLPWPVPMRIKNFQHFRFVKSLLSLQDKARVVAYRGFSLNRLNGEYNGSEEFSYKGWRWPEGLERYLRLGVPPSKEFAAFVLKEVDGTEVPADVSLLSYRSCE